jgi:hypothetical protein
MVVYLEVGLVADSWEVTLTDVWQPAANAASLTRRTTRAPAVGKRRDVAREGGKRWGDWKA